MAAIGVSPGSADLGADRAALFLKLFAGETLRLLERRLVVMDSTFVKRALAGGKTASFPSFGDASATYHVPGEDLITGQSDESVPENYLSDIRVGEHLIHADRVLQSSVLLDELEGVLSHWDHRQAFSSKLTRAVSEQSEDGLFRLIAGASGVPTASSGNVKGTLITGWPTGTAFQQATIAAKDIYDKVYAAAEAFDTNNVEKEGRVGATTTSLFYGVLRLTGTTPSTAYEVVQRDFVGSGGVNGDLAKPNTMGVWIGNVFLMPSNGIPTSAAGKYTNNSWSLNSTDQNPYAAANMAKGVKLLVWSGETVGTVKARAPRLDVNWIPERLAHLITLSQAVGHGVLRPEASYSARTTV